MEPLYDHIGVTYDTTRKADPEITRRLRNHLQVSNRSRILDLACGTGNYTVALEETGLQMTGIDLSKEMIKKAEEKSDSVTWEIANVKKLPFDQKSFDGLTCTLAAHHFDELLTPFQEAYRVLDKGRFVLFTSTPEQMNNYWLKEYFPEAIEKSAQQMPCLREVEDALKTAGFRIVGYETFLIQPDLVDFFLYSGKYEPKMYLIEDVRKGISTFANIASKEEIKEGCIRLKRDIESKKIDEVTSKYSSSLGDYVFVVAEKK
ncbi:class I SAM-dependent methyltransferase [Anaerobacillus alkaliphilus]|uniref:Class I SAM-dependent methyltransferase n=1 Tax=Anaerobacillus alkaliphilus TaxID=1548597 RepID=A0A4Q0VNH1_9BACI|nr:methyltransferase domain-containing protein [Anaerobacillus alkaliphilus]RXI96372.1 class I SAM-dependent methyltransferase [Anaerobacillus alkaliphilus]